MDDSNEEYRALFKILETDGKIDIKEMNKIANKINSIGLQSQNEKISEMLADGENAPEFQCTLSCLYYSEY